MCIVGPHQPFGCQTPSHFTFKKRKSGGIEIRNSSLGLGAGWEILLRSRIEGKESLFSSELFTKIQNSFQVCISHP